MIFKLAFFSWSIACFLSFLFFLESYFFLGRKRVFFLTVYCQTFLNFWADFHLIGHNKFTRSGYAAGVTDGPRMRACKDKGGKWLVIASPAS